MAQRFITIRLILGSDRWRCGKCNTEQIARHRHNKKQWCADYLGGKCIKCGYNKCLAALEFHHRDPTKKDFGFSQSQRFAYDKLAKEPISDLLCANCHREEHVRLKIKL